jgi:hypothetical protein
LYAVAPGRSSDRQPWLRLNAPSSAYSLVFIYASALLVIAAQPLCQRFKQLVERLAYGIRHRPEDLVRLFTDRIPTALSHEALARLLKKEVLPTLMIRQSARPGGTLGVRRSTLSALADQLP